MNDTTDHKKSRATSPYPLPTVTLPLPRRSVKPSTLVISLTYQHRTRRDDRDGHPRAGRHVALARGRAETEN